MLTLAVAVAIASLLGSLHCVGMCGPFALWATQGGRSASTVAAYHVGRLTTYLSAGLVAGVIGSALTIGGELAGYQSLAAKLAGGLLVLVGVGRLAAMLVASRFAGGKFARLNVFPRRGSPDASKPSRIAALIHQARPLVAGRGDFARAYFGGLLTTWLPCGWLYLFVLLAAGTGDVMLALTTMAAFWVGTLPALTALVVGANSLIPRFRTALPLAASLLMIATGLYTATGRASADLSRIVPPLLGPQPETAELIKVTDQKPPCCDP